MASSSHNPELSWDYRPIFADPWISGSFSRDTDALTKALQHTLSYYPDTLTTDDARFPKPETTSSRHTHSGSGSDPETPPTKRKTNNSAGVVVGGKIGKSKRKSRATKRSTTTFINADPSNFRQMVQQVTGASFLNGKLQVGPLVKPEPQRAFSRFQGCLPTLDTSEFLLDHHHLLQVAGTASGYVNFAAPGPVADGGAGFDFESLVASFPTLESWKVM